MESMSKKERLARGSAVIKVMRVTPRPGHFLKSYTDVYKLPKKPKPPYPGKPPSAEIQMALAEMPYLDVKRAMFDLETSSAKIQAPPMVTSLAAAGVQDPCAMMKVMEEDESDIKTRGLPDGHYLIKRFGYREWAKTVYPPDDGNLAEHFNILLGLLMSMTVDPENENFPDAEAYPCVQFLRTVKTPDGEVPYNIASFIEYVEFICMKKLEEA